MKFFRSNPQPVELWNLVIDDDEFMNTSSLFTLNTNDFVKGAIIAVIGAVAGAVYTILKNSGFDVFSIDWSLVLQASVNAGIISFVAYLGKNFLTNNDPHETVAGIIPTK